MQQNSIDELENDVDKYLLGQFKLAYIAGKGRNYVPIRILVDLIEGTQLLLANRKLFDISENNNILFATKSSKSIVLGGMPFPPFWDFANGHKNVKTQVDVHVPILYKSNSRFCLGLLVKAIYGLWNTLFPLFGPTNHHNTHYQ